MCRTFLKWTLLLALLAPPLTGAAQKLTIYTEELPPLNFTEQGQLTGLSVEVVESILEHLGTPQKIQSVPWARGYRAALEEPNVVLFSTTRTEEREASFKWVGPLAQWSYVFYKKRGNPLVLESLDDARSVPAIATYRDDAREQFLIEHQFTNLDSSPKLISCARKLMEGRVDLWLDSNLTAHQIMQQIGYQAGDIEEVISVKTNYLYIAFSKATDDAIVQSWQSALNAMVDDGRFADIYRKWLPTEAPPSALTADIAIHKKLLAKTRAYTEELPPLNFMDQGEISGSSTEVVRELAKRMQIDLPISLVPWARGYRLAQEEKNVALYTTAHTQNRDSMFKWVGPIGSNNTVFYARKDSGITIDSLEQAKRVRGIGTYADDVDEQMLKNLGFTNLFSHSKPESIVRNLMSGRIDLWIAGDKYAASVIKAAGYSLDDVEAVYTLRQTKHYIAFSKETPDQVVDIWQRTLDAITRDGTMDRITARWFGQ